MEHLRKINEFLTSFTGENLPWGIALLKAFAAIIGAFILWVVFRKLVKAVFKRLEKYEFVKANQEVLNAARQALFYGLILATGLYLIQIAGLVSLERPFYAIMLVCFAAPGKKAILMALSYGEKIVAQKTETKFDDILFDLAKRFCGVLVYAVCIIFALDIVGINIMPVIAGASVMGVAIGFAAKDTLSNFIAGILLLIDRPFEIGDRIEVWNAPAGTAAWGDVIDIGMRATKILTTDNMTIIIPNNEIMTRDIINYTAGSNSIRVRVDIGVAYDADIARAKKIALDVASENPMIMKKPAPAVVVRNFGESSVDLQVRVWIHEARNRMRTIDYITDSVKAEFDRQGIEIPFPRRDIVVRKEEA